MEPCYSQYYRQGYVADVQNQPAASKIYVWGNPGDSSISFGCSMPPPSPSPSLSPPSPIPDWTTAVAIGDQGQVITDVGKDEFNTQFRICPVVRYRFKNLQHSVYVRTSSVPDGMDPHDYFTRHWSSTSNVLGTDFELYDSLDDARANQDQWGYCNYDDEGVGYPRDCGKTALVGARWFAMPSSSRYSGTITGASFALFTGAQCPSPSLMMPPPSPSPPPPSPSPPSPPACLRVEGTNANLDGQYEPQFTATGTYYYARTGQSWTTGGAGYARTDGSMVIRTNGNRGGWNFCAASGGVVVEPCYAQNGRAGYVGDVQSQPAASEIYDWGQSGDSFLSFGC